MYLCTHELSFFNFILILIKKNLSCKLPRQCGRGSIWRQINPLAPLLTFSSCIDGCDFSDEVKINHKIYYNLGDEINQHWIQNPDHIKYLAGNFKIFENVLFFKISHKVFLKLK